MSIRPLNNYGEKIASASEAQVVANPTTKQATPPIETDRYCRNGQHPNAALQNQINQAANAAVLYRSKEVFSGDAAFISHDAEPGNSSFGAGDRARWRFAFHTGPYSHALYCVVVMRPPTSGYTNNTYGRLDLATNTAGTPVVASQVFAYGNDPSNGTGTQLWNSCKVVTCFIDGISGDTDYYGTFYDVDYGWIQSACIFDLQSMTEGFSGYLAQNITTGTSITGLQRQNPVTINNALWQVGGAHVLNYSVNDGTAPHTTTSATLTNVVDGTSTGAPTAATPGYTLVMTGKDRVSQTTGVPCIMKAFHKTSGAGNTAAVYLKDSSNNTIASCVTNSTTVGWTSSGSFNLPATAAKYDLQFAVAGGATHSLYAVSIYEKG